ELVYVTGIESDQVFQIPYFAPGTFVETEENNGMLSGSAKITLEGGLFTTTTDSLTAPQHFGIQNLPTGLTPLMVVNSERAFATLYLTGNASSNESANDLSSLEINFTDAAFDGLLASNVTNATNASSDFPITFSDNNPPVVDNPLANIQRETGFSPIEIDISNVFSDVDVQQLDYSATSDNIDVATVSVVGTTLTVTETGLGNSNITVTVDDSNGGSASESFAITIFEPVAKVNFGPAISGTFNVGANEDVPQGLSFNQDGTKLFIVGSEIGKVSQYSLSIPYDINSTITFDGSYEISQDQFVSDVAFSNDGSTMFVLAFGFGTDRVYQFSLGTPFDVTAEVTLQKSSPGISFDSNPIGLAFNSDGTKIYIAGGDSDIITEYTLGSAFDVVTWTSGSSFNVSDFDNGLQDVHFNADGSEMYVVGVTHDNVYKFALETPFSLAGEITLRNSLYVGNEETSPRGLTTNPSNDFTHITGIESDRVIQISEASSASFSETAANNGTMSGTATISLEEVLFADGIDTLEAPTHFTISNLADGLIPVMVVADDRKSAVLSLTGTASSSDQSDFVRSLEIDFTDAAFDGLTAATVENAIDGVSGISLIFTDNTIPVLSKPVEDLLVDFGFGEIKIDLDTVFTDPDEQVFTYSANSDNTAVVTVSISESILTITETGSGVSNVTISIDDNDGGSASDLFAVTVSASPKVIFGETVISSFDVSSEEDAPQGLVFNNDGTRLFVVGSETGEVNQYSLSTPFDLSGTNTLEGTFTITADNFVSDIAFNTDGTKMFVLAFGFGTDEVLQYDLTNPFDITSGVTASSSSPFISFDSNPVGIAFSADGNKIFIAGSNTDQIQEYELSNPFDISSFTLLSTFDASAFDTGLQDVHFNQIGSEMYTVDVNTDNVYRFQLENNFSLAGTITLIDTLFVGAQATSPRGLTTSADNSTVYVTGIDSDQVHQFPQFASGLFSESSSNDGTLTGSATISLSEVLFVAGVDTLQSPQHFSINDLPNGLTPFMAVSDDRLSATLVFSGSAVKNESSDNVEDLIINFTDDAFTDFAASEVMNATNTNSQFAIAFMDNNPPVVVNPLADLRLDTGFETINIDFSNVFEDADNDPLEYSIQVGSDLVITATIDGIELTINEVGPGSTNIILTAIDGKGGIVSDEFEVEVTRPSITYGIGLSASLNISDQEIFPQGLAFSADGTKLFAVGSDGDEINQYSLSEAYSLSGTVTFDGNFPINQDDFISGVTFSTDGMKMFVLGFGFGTDQVFQYSLSTAFDITSSVSLELSSPRFADERNPTGIAFSNDGMKLFVTGGDTDQIDEYSLENPFDVASITLSASFDLSSIDNAVQDIVFSKDGTKMYVVGVENASIYLFDLETPFTLNEDNISLVSTYNVGQQESSPRGIAINDLESRLFVAGIGSATVYQYEFSQFTLTESNANSGAITQEAALGISNSSFANAGGTLEMPTHFSITNLPEGLTAQMTVAANGQAATLTFGGSAVDNEDTDDVAALEFTFTDAAFTNAPASVVENAIAANSGFAIDFLDNLDAPTIEFTGDDQSLLVSETKVFDFSINAPGLIETISATSSAGEVQSIDFEQGAENTTLSLSYLAPASAQEVTANIIVTDQLGQESTLNFTITVNAITSTGGLLRQSLQVYPNPTTDIVNVELPAFIEETPEIILTDLNGKRINISPIGNKGRVQLNLSALPKGVYLLFVKSTDLIPERIIKN
ncbi:MAG: beta-propeller fold lactonase family protein, partial [Bacteroidota bacterium]